MTDTSQASVTGDTRLKCPHCGFVHDDLVQDFLRPTAQTAIDVCECCFRRILISKLQSCEFSVVKA